MLQCVRIRKTCNSGSSLKMETAAHNIHTYDLTQAWLCGYNEFRQVLGGKGFKKIFFLFLWLRLQDAITFKYIKYMVPCTVLNDPGIPANFSWSRVPTATCHLRGGLVPPTFPAKMGYARAQVPTYLAVGLSLCGMEISLGSSCQTSDGGTSPSPLLYAAVSASTCQSIVISEHSLRLGNMLAIT